jgi:NadR type nicotinamide-nucleotide adenylyltransferase
MEKVASERILKIVVLGPESTGKTSLVKFLADRYQTIFVPEYAREYLESIDRDYDYSDLLKIAKGQLALEESIESKANDILFCDTDLSVIKIWSNYKYGRCDPWIIDRINQNKYDLYLLCNTNIPWTPDPLREHPDSRNELFELYQTELNARQLRYTMISGVSDQRNQMAIEAIERFIQLESRS